MPRVNTETCLCLRNRNLISIVLLLALFIIIKHFYWSFPNNKNFTVDLSPEETENSSDTEEKTPTDEAKNKTYSTVQSKNDLYINITIPSSHGVIASTPRFTLKKKFRNKSYKSKNFKNRDYKFRVHYLLSPSKLNGSNVVVVRTPDKAAFMGRIDRFCGTISEERQKIISEKGLKAWKEVSSPNKLTVIWGNSDNFLNKLVIRQDILLVILPWKETMSQIDQENVLVNHYYDWTASGTLCEWIRTPAFTKAHWDAVYNRNCEENIEASKYSHVLEPMYFFGKPINPLHYWPNDGISYPRYFFDHYPSVALYMVILQDGIVNLVGDVVAGGVKIVPYTCSHDSIPTIPIEYSEVPIYKEVFVVTQFWGTSFFHRMIEVVPRFAPYVSFLKKHPSVYIHAPEDRGMVSEIMRMLGLNPERIVTGIIRAKVIYLPQGTPCGFPQAQSLQLLSYHFRAYIKNYTLEVDSQTAAGDMEYQTKSDNSTLIPSLNNLTRKTLVMIKRSGTRRFLQQREIEYVLKNFTKSNELDFVIFSDNPSPGLLESALMFNSALIVVAPHGAGLSNIIHCEPGVLVIEGVCNPPHVNMCFQFVSHVLGHRYHGIPSRSGCESFVDIDPQSFLDVLEAHKSIVLTT